MAHLETPAVKQKHSRQEVWLWPSRCFILSSDSEVSKGDENTMSIHTFMNMATKELANTLVDIFSQSPTCSLTMFEFFLMQKNTWLRPPTPPPVGQCEKTSQSLFMQACKPWESYSAVTWSEWSAGTDSPSLWGCRSGIWTFLKPETKLALNVMFFKEDMHDNLTRQVSGQTEKGRQKTRMFVLAVAKAHKSPSSKILRKFWGDLD